MNTVLAILCFIMSIAVIAHSFWEKSYDPSTSFLWYTAGVFWLSRDSK